MHQQTAEDTALTDQVRAGDSRAAEELYRRHHPALLAFARRLCQDPHTAEDLANEAFARTLRTVRTGTGGPSAGWRPYLYVVARNTAAEWARADQRLVLTAEFRDDDLTVAGPEPPDELVARAYRSLPPRWQTVLWHTLIEDEDPERVATILGITPGNVSVLAFRAREGLRKAYLAAHVTVSAPGCRAHAEGLAVAVRKKRGRLPQALRAHLESCPSCARAHSELLDLNATLRAALPIALLPFAAEGLGKAAGMKAPVAKAVMSKNAASKAALGWAGGAAVAATAVVIALTAPWAAEPRSPKAAGPAPSPVTPSEPERSPGSQSRPERSPAPPSGRPERREPARTARPTAAGIRIGHAGRCTGVAGGRIASLGCADPRAGWRLTGAKDRFQLVNVMSGQCLTAGEKYDTASFNGGGIRAVRLAPCSAAPAQRWKRPVFSDGVPRLVSVPSGMALSIGKEFGGKRPPTAFILYGAYTGSGDQRVRLLKP
ncbi:sigma-70 family RNA polymerase sigma factor [Nonomuraea sp. NPDC059194]|uniref:sigma-70 family RNA polymerase sigma factor n=1 Tax=Nonomuraea sp. NPDC059194 TaxID=3346764 RepID=UPI0036870E6D